ncbi:hypothetical protein MTP10_33800 [Nonomuraea sp. 3-1Str]|uniref:hypothetical protein n=1 Tax=Nonomuraea sp. 3-1Str TaxID=2929801 RepID=UPI002861DB3F|nr:hypothetical protein [Nonomuraea sp. 3-1Str]MDR8413694.1 hypothetical protein [Nonomuraea sp. 3-1Str]
MSGHIGHPDANRFEHLFARAKWGADLLRDEVRGYVIEHSGRPDAVLIAHDTTAIKKGTKSIARNSRMNSVGAANT